MTASLGRSLTLRRGPFRSKIKLVNGSVSGVSLDVFGAGGDDLPPFTRSAWPGLNSAAVRRVLGTPSEQRHEAFFGIDVEQLIFRRPGEPEASLFFAADRLVAKRVGQAIPADIFRITLPSPPDETNEDMLEGTVRVGIKASDVRALYGAAKLDVAYRFNGQPAAHAIYQARPGGSFVSLTFVDGVLTAFDDIGRWPEDDTFQGR